MEGLSPKNGKPFFTFGKHERLKKELHIKAVFKEKTFSVFQYPIKLTFHFHQEPNERAPARVLLSVSKKKFKRAHQRNRIKRLMREAWRHHKHLFYESLEQNQKAAWISLMYVADDESKFDDIMIALFKLSSKFNVALQEAKK